MLPNLNFLPPVGVIEDFQELAKSIRLLYADIAEDLLLYFEDTDIDSHSRNVPNQPLLFAIVL